VFKHLVYFILLFINSVATNAELTESASMEDGNSASIKIDACTTEQKEENEEIIRHCETNWKKWGFSEKPPLDELLSATTCHSSSNNTIKGCEQALMSLPVLFGEIAVIGMVKLTPADKQSLPYLSQNGTLQDMQAYYANQYLREKCLLGSTEDDTRFIDSNCYKPSVEKIDCNPYLEKVRKAMQCRNSPATRRWYKSNEKLAVINPAQKLYKEQMERKAAEMRHKDELSKLKAVCGPIMNPYSETYKKIFLHPLRYLGTNSANFIKPNSETVEKYNKCILDNSKGNTALQNELQKNGSGLIGSVLGSFESLKCYRKDIQAQLKCEVAMAIASGGTAIGLATLKKLTKKKLETKLAEKETTTTLSASQVNKIELTYARFLAAAGKDKDEVIETITRLEARGVSKKQIVDELNSALLLCK
jgi:hypothetical protein